MLPVPCLPGFCHAPSLIIMDWISESVIQPQLNVVLIRVALVIVTVHSSQTLTKIPIWHWQFSLHRYCLATPLLCTCSLAIYQITMSIAYEGGVFFLGAGATDSRTNIMMFWVSVHIHLAQIWEIALYHCSQSGCSWSRPPESGPWCWTVWIWSVKSRRDSGPAYL